MDIPPSVLIVCAPFQYIGPTIAARVWVIGEEYQHWNIHHVQWEWEKQQLDLHMMEVGLNY